jgi:plastocyanin
MRVPRDTRRIAARSLAILLLAAGACGGDDATTNPPSGGKELDSGNVANGGVYQHTFANAGFYSYHCALHACMTHGTVTVTSGQQDSALVNIVAGSGGCPQGAYSPLNVSINPGGFVRWTNQSTTHTVTSD